METSGEAAARRKRVRLLNAIGVAASIAAVIFLRFGVDDLPESAQPPAIVAVVVGLVLIMAVLIPLFRRQWGADFRRAVLLGEVAPDANREELKRDLEQAQPNMTFAIFQAVLAVTAGIALVVGGLVAGIWWLSLIGLACAVPMPVLFVYTRRRCRNMDRALAALDA